MARNLPGGEFSLTHDAENHLIEVQVTNQPTSTATPTETPTEAPTATPTETPTEIPGTPQGSQPGAAKVFAARLRLQEIDTPTPTEEISETPLPAPTETETEIPTAQPSETAQPTPSQTPTPLESATATATQTVFFTETPTETPTLIETATETPTPTPSETPALKSGLAGMSVFQSAYYVYDGDGNLMRGTVNGRVTFYPGRGYNQVVEGSSVTVQKFYALGSLTIAVRTLQGTLDSLNWALSDHLGSTSVTANADGSWNSTLKYREAPCKGTAFGEVRSQEGSTPTEYKYTGQLEQAEIGLYYYVARWYDSELAHFVQADTIVPQPGMSVAYDRYAYALNNPIRYSDPSGHDPDGFRSKEFEEFWQTPNQSVSVPTTNNTVQSSSNNNASILNSAWNSYMDGWNNFSSATSIITNRNTKIKDRIVASYYVFAWGGSHVALAAGVGGVAYGLMPVCAAGGATAVFQATGGDPSDEIKGATQAFGNLSRAAEYSIQPFNKLKPSISGTGLQVHHIIEQRFALALQQTAAQTRQWLSIALDTAEHQKYTNAWRKEIGYFNSRNMLNTTSATVDDIWAAAQRIYADSPALLDAAKTTLGIR